LTHVLDISPWGAIAGAVVLVLFVLAKLSVLRFRKHAVEVSGEVMQIFGRRQHTADSDDGERVFRGKAITFSNRSRSVGA
jgi:hypothetical protein